MSIREMPIFPLAYHCRKATKYWDSKVKANSVDPDQTAPAPAGAVLSGSTLPILVHYCIVKPNCIKKTKNKLFHFQGDYVFFFWCPSLFRIFMVFYDFIIHLSIIHPLNHVFWPFDTERRIKLTFVESVSPSLKTRLMTLL